MDAGRSGAVRGSSADSGRATSPALGGAPPALQLEGLTVDLRIPGRGPVPVLEDIALSIAPGQVLALAGESGSGKTLLGLTVAGLLPSVAQCRAGRLALGGTDVFALPAAQRRALNGRHIGMVFQEPMTALNPVWRVGRQILEVPRLHGHGTAEAREMAFELLAALGLREPARVMAAYPHELSGGMRQRVVIAMALILRPPLLIADEPTTALDVTVQRRILDRLRLLAQRSGTAMLLITHDLGVVAEMADEVAILYAGRIVERAPVHALFDSPAHPYTQGLLAARPAWPQAGASAGRPALKAMPGQVPLPGTVGAGCAYAPRCARAEPPCGAARPPLQALPDLPGDLPGHVVACGPASRSRPPGADGAAVRAEAVT